MWKIFSAVLVLLLNFLFLVLVVALVTNSYTEFWDFLKACWVTTKEYFAATWRFIKYTLVPFLKDLWQRIILLLCKDCPRPEATPTRPVGK